MDLEQLRLGYGLNFVGSEYGPVTALFEYKRSFGFRKTGEFLERFISNYFVWFYLTAL
jgi:hypothetical protein